MDEKSQRATGQSGDDMGIPSLSSSCRLSDDALMVEALKKSCELAKPTLAHYLDYTPSPVGVVVCVFIYFKLDTLPPTSIFVFILVH
jgi:hypothetical protein